MKYYVIAGEASGDLHAANLIKEIKLLDTTAEFRAWGGDLMDAQGAEVIKHYRDLAFMGFTEVILNLRAIVRNLSFCKKDILSWKPDVLILVDYPGFNLRIADFAHKNKLKVFYYISPQIWAWKQGRVHDIKKNVDEMFVILPFEKEFYKRFGMDVNFIGHPLLDAVTNFHSVEDFRKRNGLDHRPIIALLPGSRQQEISRMLPVMLNAVKSFPQMQVVIAGAPSTDPSIYRKITGEQNVKVVFAQTYQLLATAHTAAVTSGTATLEAALFGVPLVVCYRGGNISYQVAKQLIKVKYISLVNLILDRPAVTELIQNDMNATRLREELGRIIIEGHIRESILKDLEDLRALLGGPGASKRAALQMMTKLKTPNLA